MHEVTLVVDTLILIVYLLGTVHKSEHNLNGMGGANLYCIGYSLFVRFTTQTAISIQAPPPHTHTHFHPEEASEDIE